MRVEILSAIEPTMTAARCLRAINQAVIDAGDSGRRTTTYQGGSDVLILFGIGAPAHDEARQRQLANGGRVLHFDLGYFGNRKRRLRFSIDRDHPQHLLHLAPDDASRWLSFGIELREDFSADGPVIIAGMGPKSVRYLGPHWDDRTFARMKAEHPSRKVLFRPKGEHASPIAVALRGASRLVAHHSNCCVDAVIAGVPFEAEDGAAMWLTCKPFTRANRFEFLRRLAHFQYDVTEASECWRFAKRILKCSS